MAFDFLDPLGRRRIFKSRQRRRDASWNWRRWARRARARHLCFVEPLEPRLLLAGEPLAADPDPNDTDPPAITVSLANDTGRIALDTLTFDPTMTGTVVDANTVTSFQAKLDGGPFVDVLGLLAGDSFTLTPADLQNINSNLPLADGPHTLTLIAADDQGNAASEKNRSFILDATAPAQPLLDLLEVSDTGIDDADNITTDHTLSLRVHFERGGARVAVQVFTDGASRLDSNAFDPQDFVLPFLPDGVHELQAWVRDEAGNISDFSVPVSVTIDSTSPTTPTLDLAADSDTPPIGDQRTFHDTVTLEGMTDPNTAVSLASPSQTTTSDATGVFSFTVVPLALGDNLFQVVATDLAGNPPTLGSQTITRLTGSVPSQISGVKWHDLNEDGVKDPGEPGIEGWIIYADANDDGLLDSGRETAESGVLNQTVPRFQTISSDLVLTDNGGRLVDDVNVTLNINHRFDQDLDVFLISPVGTRVELFTDVGGGGDHFTDTTLDDEATTPITSGSAPFTGSFQPEQSLTTFNGEDPVGEWKLEVTHDGQSLFPATLLSWSLTVAVDEHELFTKSGTDGTYTLNEVPPGEVTVREELQPNWTQTFPAGDGSHVLTVTEGAAINDINFGNTIAPAEIHGVKWYDANRDGVRDEGELGIPNWVIFIDDNDNGTLDGGETSAMTDALGAYVIPGLAPGTYTVAEEVRDADPIWEQTFPVAGTHSVTLVASQVLIDTGFGNFQRAHIIGFVDEDLDEAGLSPKAGETVFLDLNANGLRDPAEPSVVTQSDNPMTPEDEEGLFIFENVLPGAYQVAIELMPGFVQTTPADQSPIMANVAGGQILTGLQFIIEEADIDGTVYHDINRNGAQDPGEPPLEGWSVELDKDDDGVADDLVVTDAIGQYGFVDVGEGTFRVRQILEMPYIQTDPDGPESGTYLISLMIGDPKPDPANFGLFHPPNLTVNATPTTKVFPGQMFNLDYRIALDGPPGNLAPDDEWQEHVYITDDGLVDNNGFELLVASNTFTDAGARLVPITMPDLGPVPSETGTGVISIDQIIDGLIWVIRVDPPASMFPMDAGGNVIETDEDDNDRPDPVKWNLPDLAVVNPFLFQTPFIAPVVSLAVDSDGNRRLQISGDVKYPVANLGPGEIPPGTSWTERIFLGTDTDVNASDDVVNGVWHVMIGEATFNSSIDGPLAPNSIVERTVSASLPAMEIPKDIRMSKLQWIVVLDPVSSLIGPGDLLEVHEVPPTQVPPFNNALAQPLHLTFLVGVSSDGAQKVDPFAPRPPMGLASSNPLSEVRSAAAPDVVGLPFRVFQLGDHSKVSLSDDGRFVTFSSGFDGLIPADPNDDWDVFLHDRDVDEDGLFDEPGAISTIRISGGSLGSTLQTGPRSRPTISGDGNFITFLSDADDLVPGDTNAQRDVFVYERQTGFTTRVSLNSAGHEGVGFNDNPKISADGRYVVFDSISNNFVHGNRFDPDTDEPDLRNPWAGDNNGKADVFLHDTQTGETLLASTTDGTEGIGGVEPTISADGRYIAFRSTGPSGSTHGPEIYLKDMQTGALTRVTFGNGPSWRPIISANGGKIIFQSRAADIVPIDANANGASMFVWDRVLNEFILVSIDEDGIQLTAEDSVVRADAGISAAGRLVTFTARPGGVDRFGGPLLPLVYLRDLAAEHTEQISIEAPGLPPDPFGNEAKHATLSANGRWAGFNASSISIVDGITTAGIFNTFVRYVEQVPLGDINGIVYNDANKNASLDAGETGLENQVVQVFRADPDTPTVFSLFKSVGTDSNGFFTADVPQEGSYKIQPLLSTGAPYLQTDPDPDTGDGRLEVAVDSDTNYLLGLFPLPDLRVLNFTQHDPVAFGQDVTITYEVANDEPLGVINPTMDSWVEQLFLTDDGAVDGSGYEKLFFEQTFTAVGVRNLTFTAPVITPDRDDVAGTPGIQDAKKGLRFVVRLDHPDTISDIPEGNLQESDDDNNSLDRAGEFLLPDLAVTTLDLPVVFFDALLGDPFVFKVENLNQADAPIGATTAWTIHVGLGTDEKLWLPDDLSNEVWHHIVTTLVVTGPPNATDYMEDVDLTGIKLPPEIDPMDVKWVILVDWPSDVGDIPVIAADSDPGDVLESHEVPDEAAPPTDPTAIPANAFISPAFGVDLSPLMLDAITESFMPDAMGNFMANGIVNVGLKPTMGESFLPLFSVDGTTLFNEEVIQFDGVVHPLVGDLNRDLFHGMFEINVGEAKAEDLIHDPASMVEQFVVIGSNMTLDTIELFNPGGPESAADDGQIRLTGQLDLPEELIFRDIPTSDAINNLLTFDVPESNPLVISSNGLSLNTIRVAPTDINVDAQLLSALFKDYDDFIVTALGVPKEGIIVRILDLDAKIGETTAGDPRFVVHGQFQLNPFGVELNAVDGNPLDMDPGNFIQITEGTAQEPIVDIVGEITATKIPIIPGALELSDVKIKRNEIDNKFEAKGKLKLAFLDSNSIPFDSLVGGIGFKDGQLDSLTLGVSGLDIKLGRVPLKVTKIQGKLEGISKIITVDYDETLNTGILDFDVNLSNLDEIKFIGTVGFADLQSKIAAIPLPAKLGGPRLNAQIFKMDISADLANFILLFSDTGGVVKLLDGAPGGPIVQGDIKYDLDLDAGTSILKGNLSILNGLASGSVFYKIDTNLNIVGRSKATINIPTDFFGPLPGGFFNPLSFFNGLTRDGNIFVDLKLGDNDPANDIISIWGKGFTDDQQIGLRFALDGTETYLGADEIERLSGPSPGAVPVASGDRFVVSAMTPWLMLGSQWQNNVSGVAIEVVDPNGTVFTEADMALNDDLTLLTGAPTQPTQRGVNVASPIPGNWLIRVVDDAGLGLVEFNALGGSTAPTIAITNLTDDITLDATGMIAIDYAAADPDSDASVALFYDNDREGHDGFQIVGGIIEADASANFNWDTSAIPPGDYFIYGVAEDDTGIKTFGNYSLGHVRIADPLAPAAVPDVQAKWVGGDRILVTWTEVPNADRYEVRYSADAAGDTLDEQANTLGPVNGAVVTGLTAGETYRFSVHAVNRIEVTPGEFASHTSRAGEPVVGVVGATPTVAPDPGQWEVFADPGTLFSAQVDVQPGDTLDLALAPTGATLNAAGRFEWNVPADAAGWVQVIVNVTLDNGEVEQIRRNLLSDADRTVHIIGRNFEDLDGDAVYDAGEIGLNGWTVELIDVVSGGVLQTRVTGDIDLDNSGTIETATERGVYRFLDLTPGIYGVREVLLSGWDAVGPAEVNVVIAGGDEVTVGFANRPQDGEVTGTAFDDTNGDGVHDSNELGVPGVTIYADLNQNEVLDEATFSFESGDTSAAISDLAKTNVPLRVTGLAGVITDVQLGFDIAHGYIGDLDISLVSPAGNSVLMLSNVGGDDRAFVETTLDDAAGTSIGDAVPPFKGTFRPRFPLSFFDGEDPNGVWTLRIEDNAAGDIGTLNRWSLAVTVAEPSVVTTADDLATAETDESGQYALDNLPPQLYEIHEDGPSSSLIPFVTVDLQAGQHVADVNFRSPPGDIDRTGGVDFVDFLILSANFGRQNTSRAQGDLDGDGAVLFPDFLILAANFGRTITHRAPAALAENSQLMDAARLARAVSADEFFERFGNASSLDNLL